MGPDGSLDRTTRKWAMAAHLVALVGLVGNGVGFLLGPLFVWLLKREDHPFIDEQGKEALNFQITMFGAFFLAAILIVAIVGIVLLPILAIYDVVMVIVASIKASNGEHFRYPLIVRVVR